MKRAIISVSDKTGVVAFAKAWWNLDASHLNWWHRKDHEKPV